MFLPFSEWALLISGMLLFFLLGWLWYNPITPTGKIWTSYFPMPKKMPPKSQFIIMMAFQLFMGFILAHTVMVIWMLLGRITLDDSSISVLSSIVKTIIITKLFMGFVFIKDLGHWYFEGKPFKLVLIGTGYYLVGVLGVCVMLSYFL
jgi:hypothetical protein